MYLPHISVAYSNNNLLKNIDAIDGIAGICATVDTVGFIGRVWTVFNLLDAVGQGITEVDEPFLYRHVKEFYDEVGGNQEFWIMGTADTQTLNGVLDNNDETGAKKLIRVSNGKIRLLGVTRKPNVGYNAGNAFYDAETESSFLKAKTFCEARLTELIPLRVLIEGRVVNDSSLDRFEPKTAQVGSAGLVVGGSANDGSASVGTALGRAVKYGAHIKLGKVANGPLSISTVYIGTKLLKDFIGLDSLHGTGIISFMQHPNRAGYYFGVDRMASTDDYRYLAYGRVTDKAAIICAATYQDDLEAEANIDKTGNIDETEIKHLKDKLTLQVNAQMADQVSDFTVYIDPAQPLIDTSTLKVKARVKPLGYKTFIEVDLGLTASATA